jgi:hypothetical protein
LSPQPGKEATDDDRSKRLNEMVRPERFELPTFCFLARGEEFYLVDLISLTSFQDASNWTPESICKTGSPSLKFSMMSEIGDFTTTTIQLQGSHAAEHAILAPVVSKILFSISCSHPLVKKS